MKSVSELFLLLKNLFEVGMSVAERNVLKTVLVDLLILFSLYTLPVFYHLCVQLSAGSAEYCVLCHTALKLFELMFDLFALRLLFVKFSLEFACHAVIAVLCFL
jgi:hypothetical protein